MANYDSSNTGANIDSAVNQIIDSSTDLNVDSNSLVVDKSANNVGIGVTAPGDIANGLSLVPDLEIRGAAGTGAACAGVLALTTAETSTVDGDVQGAIVFQSPIDGSGTDAILSGAAIWAEADATFSSSVNNTELVFATNTSAAATERMRISSAGMVGIGTNNPVYRLQVNEASDIVGVFNNTSSSEPYGFAINFTAATPDDTTSFFFRGSDSAGAECYIYSDGSYSQVSDKRRKKNIVDTDKSLEKVNQLSVKNYVRKNDKSEKLHIGLIAQDVQEIYPHLITEADDDMKSLTMYKIGLIPIIIKAVQELSAKVIALENA